MEESCLLASFQAHLQLAYLSFFICSLTAPYICMCICILYKYEYVWVYACVLYMMYMCIVLYMMYMYIILYIMYMCIVYDVYVYCIWCICVMYLGHIHPQVTLPAYIPSTSIPSSVSHFLLVLWEYQTLYFSHICPCLHFSQSHPPFPLHPLVCPLLFLLTHHV